MNRSLLRWVGGKSWLMKWLAPQINSATTAGTYFEPFVGGGAAFFALAPARAVLGDLNHDLVNYYRHVRSDPAAFTRAFRALPQEVDAGCYRELRERFNDETDPHCRAALFLALNLTSFNGIWRVNQSGRFNVPYGDRPKLCRVSDEDITATSSALQGATLAAVDFEALLDRAETGDFAFLDPPYEAVSAQECFSRYTLSGFGIDQHKRVADIVGRLQDRGCRFVLTVAETELAHELYRSHDMIRVQARRVAAAHGAHRLTSDLVISNIPIIGQS